MSEFFRILADDWGKPVSKLQEYLNQLEDEMIDTVEDLELLKSDSEAWSKIKSKWPSALPRRIEAKLANFRA